MSPKADTPNYLGKNYIFEYVVAFSATLLMISSGNLSGWSSPSLPKLMANDSYIPITSDDSSWLVSTTISGTIIGTFPGAWLMDRIGRKNALLTCTIPYLIGWTLIGVANSKIFLFIGKFIIGFSQGWTISVIPVYLGEIASDKIRGSLGTFTAIMGKLGILYVYSIGPYVSISTMAWICMIPVFCFIATFIWLPESPYFLLGAKRPDEAFKSLSRLRCRPDVQDELDKMAASVHISHKNKGQFKEFFTNSNKRRICLIIALAMALHLTGYQAILSYSETIFRKMRSALDPSHASIIFSVLQLITAGFSSLAMDRLGRRPLLLLSLTGVATCNTIIGFFFLFENLQYDVSNVTWLPVVALMAYTIFFTIGVASVPYIIMGEIFPKNVKSIAAVVFVLTIGVTVFITVKCFQIVSDNLGNEYAFFGLAICSYTFLIIFWCFLPETKGKSLDEIVKDFNAKNT